MSEVAMTMENYADRINEAHGRAVSHAASALEDALEVGRLLTEAKAACKHGEWLPWLREKCVFAERTAQAYMRLYGQRLHIEERYLGANAQRVADFSVRGALKFLERPMRRHTAPENINAQIESLLRAHEAEVLPPKDSIEYGIAMARRIREWDAVFAQIYGIRPEDVDAYEQAMFQAAEARGEIPHLSERPQTETHDRMSLAFEGVRIVLEESDASDVWDRLGNEDLGARDAAMISMALQMSEDYFLRSREMSARHAVGTPGAAGRWAKRIIARFEALEAAP